MPDSSNEARRLTILQAVREKLVLLDPVMHDVDSVRVTVRLRRDGEVRVVIVEPEMRYETRDESGRG